MKRILLILITLFVIPTSHAEQLCSCRHDLADSHAPIGIMGDHTHNANDLMLSYRYMNMQMDGNRSGSSRVTNQSVLGSYMVSPTDMEMEMHMLGAMYGVNDKLTLMAMLPILNISMNHLTRMGGTFETEANGIGDIRLSTIYKFYQDSTHTLVANTGISLPTGEIDERDNTPMGYSQLPYPMQLGSGTYDLLPGVTYTGRSNDITWGAQVMGTIRLDENSNDYTLGNAVQSSIWTAYAFSDSFSSSFRLAWNSWGNIDGADKKLNPMMVPTADPELRGGERLDLGIGFNALIPSGPLHDLRLAVEYLFPIYQDLDGPQLETDGTLVIGLQKVF